MYNLVIIINNNNGDYVENNGITRKIDSVGRIVIPREIRKNLKIGNDQDMLITINNDNIVLSKYEKINNDFLFNILIKSFSKELNKNFIITNLNKIISSNKKFNDYNLNSNYINKMLLKEDLCSFNGDILNINNDNIDCSYIISPLIINGNLYGSIIMYSDNLNNNDYIYLNLLKKILINYIEEYE